jgi:hypothetical protein
MDSEGCCRKSSRNGSIHHIAWLANILEVMKRHNEYNNRTTVKYKSQVTTHLKHVTCDLSTHCLEMAR